jgi:Lar family restriction alleviation protein
MIESATKKTPLPCPFCGAQHFSLSINYTNGIYTTRIDCRGCGISFQSESTTNELDRWNTRHSPTLESTADDPDFVMLVTKMRQAQKDYFRTRDVGHLTESKSLERQVDQYIEDLNNPVQELQFT